MTDILKIFDLTPSDAQMILAWAIFFFVLWRVLSALCWQPLLKLLEAREAATTGAVAKLHELQQEAEDLSRSFENEILKARIEAAKAKSAMVLEAKAKAQSLLSAAEQQASSSIKNAAEQSHREAQRVEKELEAQISALSDQALAKLGIA